MHNRFMKAGVLGAVLLTQSAFFSVEAKDLKSDPANTVYPLVKLEQGVTQLCDDSQRNGAVCVSPAMPAALGNVRTIIQTDALGDAPYSWIAVGKNFAYACAAGRNPQVEVKCVRIKTNLSRFNIEKAENKILSFAFSARQSTTSLDQVGAVATQFVKAYAEAEGYLLAYGREHWGQAKSKNASSAGKDTGYSIQEYEGDDDEGGGGGGGGGDSGGGDSGGGGGDSGGGDSGGGDSGGGDSGGTSNVSDGRNIDPVTGQPPRVVVTGPLPAPQWPSNPTPCNVLGIFCNGSGNGTENPDSPAHEENKAYCDAQRQAAYNHCTSVYEINKNNLPGSGTDYPARYRICVREYLAGTGCHDY